MHDPADRVAPRKEAPDQRVVDHNHPSRPGCVVLVEDAAAQQLRADGLEVARRDAVQHHQHVLVRLRRVAGHIDRERPAAAVRMGCSRRSWRSSHRAVHSARRLELPVKWPETLESELREPGLDVDDEDVRAVEAERLSRKVGQRFWPESPPPRARPARSSPLRRPAPCRAGSAPPASSRRCAPASSAPGAARTRPPPHR